MYVSQIFKHYFQFIPTKTILSQQSILFSYASVSLSTHMLSLQRNLCICCTLSISLKEDGIVADYNGFKRRYTACYNPKLRCKYFNFSDYSLIVCMRNLVNMSVGNRIAKKY